MRLVVFIAFTVAAGPSSALASTGGVGTEPGNAAETATPSVPRLSDCPTETGGVVMGTCVPFKQARLLDGKALAPRVAAEPIQKVIEAANRIRSTPYIWAGATWTGARQATTARVRSAMHCTAAAFSKHR